MHPERTEHERDDNKAKPITLHNMIHNQYVETDTMMWDSQDINPSSQGIYAESVPHK